MKNCFTEHPKSVNETYWQHMCFSARTSFLFFSASIAAVMHAVFPFLCGCTCSNIVAKLAVGYCKGARREDFLRKINSHLSSDEQCIIKKVMNNS